MTTTMSTTISKSGIYISPLLTSPELHSKEQVEKNLLEIETCKTPISSALSDDCRYYTVIDEPKIIEQLGKYREQLKKLQPFTSEEITTSIEQLEEALKVKNEMTREWPELKTLSSIEQKELPANVYARYVERKYPFNKHPRLLAVKARQEPQFQQSLASKFLPADRQKISPEAAASLYAGLYTRSQHIYSFDQNPRLAALKERARAREQLTASPVPSESIASTSEAGATEAAPKFSIATPASGLDRFNKAASSACQAFFKFLNPMARV